MAAEGVRGPVVALTGTPGTGKSAVAEVLRAQGHRVLDLKRFVGDPRFDLGADSARSDTIILDEEALADHLHDHLVELLEVPADHAGPVFIESHFAHDLDLVDRILVLRCRPDVLAKRLGPRGWSPEKLRENLEAEVIDVILQEALLQRDAAAEMEEALDVGEVDTTERTVEEVAGVVLALSAAPPERLEIGTVDWSDEVLEWF